MGKRLEVMAKGTKAFGPMFTLNEVDREGERGKLVGVHPVAACDHEQDARRLAACWNACKGASTEVLERGAVHDWALLMTDLEKQRDELLKALKALVAYADDVGDDSTEVYLARVTIAACEVRP